MTIEEIAELFIAATRSAVENPHDSRHPKLKEALLALRKYSDEREAKITELTREMRDRIAAGCTERDATIEKLTKELDGAETALKMLCGELQKLVDVAQRPLCTVGRLLRLDAKRKPSGDAQEEQ